MTKTANKSAIKALPALRASLLWYKRETVRAIRRRASAASSPAMRAMLESKASKLARAGLADFRSSYECERVAEISRAPLAELARVVPGLVRVGYA